MTGKLFVYKDVKLSEDRKTVSFDYEIKTDEQSFELSEKLHFPKELPTGSVVDRLLRSLHLALGISYYKSFLPPEIDHAYFMDSEEAEFWNTIFEKGLGEFLYKNNISTDRLAKFASNNGPLKPGSQDDIGWNNNALLGIGGGKDSIVAGELLKKANISVDGFVLATNKNEGQARPVADKMNLDLLAINREIDPKILEINKLDDAMNGHVPISLIFALTGCLLATTSGSKYVIVANESSASIPQINEVNHQWSKSLEFERLFQAYIHTQISPELHYTSVIRPLSSVAVSKIFSRHPGYFEVFSSDNSHFKINNDQQNPRWSQDSPKSLSSFILLAPWLDDESLIRIFSKNLLDLEDLKELFLSLLGANDKPVLDCVGTPSELRVCLSMLASQNRLEQSALMRLAEENSMLDQNYEENMQKTLVISDEHAIPQELADKIIPIIESELA